MLHLFHDWTEANELQQDRCVTTAEFVQIFFDVPNTMLCPPV